MINSLNILSLNILQISKATADSRLIRHVLAVRYVVTKLALRHTLKAGPTLHLAGCTPLLQLSAFGLIFIAAIMTIESVVANRSLWQTSAQRAAMGVAFRGWLEHFAAGLVY